MRPKRGLLYACRVKGKKPKAKAEHFAVVKAVVLNVRAASVQVEISLPHTKQVTDLPFKDVHHLWAKEVRIRQVAYDTVVRIIREFHK